MKKFLIYCSAFALLTYAQINVAKARHESDLVYLIEASISGPADVCVGTGDHQFTVVGSMIGSGYTWTVPAGMTITSGAGTRTVTINFTTAGMARTISVSGNGISATTNVNVHSSIIAESPNAGHSVDMVTGTVNVGVPLFSVQDGDISIPISLQYAATGVRVTDDDGWLGHNWNVSTQSYGIFREMRGLPDDYLITTQPDPGNPDNRVGWLNSTLKTTIKNFVPSTDNNPSTCADEVSNHTFLNGINYNQDTEPDAFYVSLPGLSFSFYFDENNVAQVVPYVDVLITPNTTSGPISSFIIKDDRGIEYQFNERETLTEKMFETSPYYFIRRSNLHVKQFTYTTSWRLTKVTSPTYGMINFTYTTIETEDDDLTPTMKFKKGQGWFAMELRYKYQYPLVTSNTDGATGTMRYYRSSVMKLLDRIISPTAEAEFVSVPKYTGSILKRLDLIRLYDKRSGAPTLAREADLSYSSNGVQDRKFLSNIKLKAACAEANYGFEYNTSTAPLPAYNSADKDEWDLYKIKNFDLGMPQYNETAASGSLKKITHPLKGYTLFFYETHDYWDGTTSVQGGGIRVKKIINYDGVSSSNNGIQEFEYKAVNGNSSGKLQHKGALSFSVIKHPLYGTITRYHQIQLQSPAMPVADINAKFTVKGDQDLSNSNYLNGSAVAYERVTVKTADAGSTVYEYDLPASHGETTANSNEWVASKVLIARPSTGSSTCFDKPNIDEGYHRYPFPMNTPYNFARGQLKKITDFNDAGQKVRDVVYDYQRIYKATAARKIFGLALEELPTYYYTGSSYVDSKMFLFSKYEIFTDIKTELSKTTETIYNSIDLAKKTVNETSYFFDSPNHRLLSRTETKNSDASVTVNRIKYVHDFTLTSGANAESTALKSLKDNRQYALPVETTSSKIVNAVEKVLGAELTLFQTISSKIYPHKIFSYQSNDGNGGFVPASVTGANTFTFDANKYILSTTFQSFDLYGNPVSVESGNRDLSAVAYGYDGTLPVISVAHAGLDEIKYSDFETTTLADFTPTWGTPTYSAGLNSSKALNIPAGSVGSNILTNGITYKRSPWYTFSFWMKAPGAGTLTLLIGTTTTASFNYNYTGTHEWKYVSMRIPITSVIGSNTSFYVKIWSSVSAQLDDLAFHPEQADFVAYNYKLPVGKTVEKDSRGNYRFYEYDAWGRLRAIFDRDRNVLKTYDYQVKP